MSMTIELIKASLSAETQQEEVVEMLIQAETLRRKINDYLQKDKDASSDEWRREKLADISEDIYTTEFALGEVIGHNVVKSLINNWQ